MIKTITLALLLATTPALAQYDTNYEARRAMEEAQRQSERATDRAMQMMQQMQQQNTRPPMTCTQSCVPTANGGRQCSTNCY